MYLKHKSSKVCLNLFIPNLSASGVKISNVSCAILICFSRLLNSSVCMLWSLSASLTKATLASLPSVNNIFLKFSLSSAFFNLAFLIDSTLLNPTQMFKTVEPNFSSISFSVQFVSSKQSCKSPATTVATSARILTKIFATAYGCETYSSPLSLVWPLCFWFAKSNAETIFSAFSFPYILLICSKKLFSICITN